MLEELELIEAAWVAAPLELLVLDLAASCSETLAPLFLMFVGWAACPVDCIWPAAAVPRAAAGLMLS